MKALSLFHTHAASKKAKGWKAKANQELIAAVKGALAPRRGWQIRYVPGHAGVPLNERADALAREAVSRRATRLPTA